VGCSGRSQPSRSPSCVTPIHRHSKNGKLVSADARYEVRLTERLPHRRRNLAQCSITSVMTMAIIDGLEIVDIGVQKRRTSVEPLCKSQLSAGKHAESTEIAETCQLVDECEELKLATHLNVPRNVVQRNESHRSAVPTERNTSHLHDTRSPVRSEDRDLLRSLNIDRITERPSDKALAVATE